MDSVQKKMICIIGAGFSNAMNSAMPLCKDVMEKFIKGSIDDYEGRQEKCDLFGWHVISYLASYGFLGDEAEIKHEGMRLLTALQVLSDLSSRFLDNHLINYGALKNTTDANSYATLIQNKDFINGRRDTVKEVLVLPAIKKIVEILKGKLEMYTNLNIEEVLRLQQEQGLHHYPDSFDNTAFDQIVFDEFQHPVSENKNADRFRIFIKKTLEHFRANFISFNYDTMLEDILDGQAWHKSNGYGVSFDFMVNAEDAKKAAIEYWNNIRADEKEVLPKLIQKVIPKQEESQFKIFKPHGSVNWLVDYEKGHVVLVEKGEGTPPISIRNSDFCYVTDEDSEIQNLNTVILPPNPMKFNSLPQLWMQRKNIRVCLEEADVVVVIGWSCPSSDKNWAGQIERIFADRSKQPEHLIVVNPDRSIFDRLYALIQPKHGIWMKDINSLGTSVVIDELLDPMRFGVTQFSAV